VPAQWIWLTDTSGPFEAAFPSLPTLYDMAEVAVSADGAPIRSRRWQTFLGRGAFVLYRTPEPAGVVAAHGGPGPFAERVGRGFVARLDAQVTDPRSWDGFPSDAGAPPIDPPSSGGGWTARVKVGPAEGEVRIGLDGDVLYVLEVIGAPPAAATAFLDAARPIDTVRPVRVALPGGREAECPARCGPLEDALVVGGARVPLAGARGQLDLERFEVVAVPVGELDPDAVVAALRARALGRGSALTGETPIAGGVEVRFSVRNGVGVARVVERSGAVVAVEVIAPLGALPAWGERFLGSVR
jgi:hypothetical protein